MIGHPTAPAGRDVQYTHACIACMATKDREKDFGPLPPLIAKGLNDKLYEKRKTAALDLER